MYLKVEKSRKNENVFPTKHRKEANEFKLFFKIKIGQLKVCYFFASLLV